MMAYLISQLLINSLVAGCIYALFGVGFAINYQISRFFDFAYGAVFAIGAYACWMIFTFADNVNGQGIHISILIFACIIGTVFSALVSSFLENCVYRRLRHRGATSSISLLASLGLFTAIQNAISLLAGDDAKVIQTGPVTIGIPIYFSGMKPLRVTGIQIGIFSTTLIVGVFLMLILKYSDWGKRLRAVANDDGLAEIYGVDIAAVRLSVHFLAGALAGLAGVLVALDTALTPYMGLRMLTMVMVAMVIGGLNSLLGLIAGALIVGLAQNLSAIAIGTEWQDTVVFVLLIGCLLAKPHGLFGSKRLN